MSAGSHLDESPQEGARRLLLDLLEEAAAARARLGGDDAEALHDFRVAVRRLRSAQRTFATELGDAATKRSRRRWRRLAAATGPSRDAEAQSAWLDAALPAMAARARPAARALRSQLADRLGRERGAVETSARRFDLLAARLREGLATYTVRLDVPAGEGPFEALAARRVEELGVRLARRLAAIAGPRDETGAHAARIACKRLRYGVEFVAPEARLPLGRLKSLQEVLGELHDVHGLMRAAARQARRQAEERARALAALALERGTASLEFAGASRRRSAPSWWPLLDALHVRQRALFALLDEEWLGEEERIAARLRALAAEALGALAGDSSVDE